MTMAESSSRRAAAGGGGIMGVLGSGGRSSSRSNSRRNLFRSSLSSSNLMRQPPQPPPAPPPPQQLQPQTFVDRHHAVTMERSGSCRLPHPSPSQYDETLAPRYSRSLLLGGGGGRSPEDDNSNADDDDDDFDGFGLLPSQGGTTGHTEQDNLVDFVHHSSPVGPAVSVYPKGFQPPQSQSRSSRNRTSGNHQARNGHPRNSHQEMTSRQQQHTTTRRNVDPPPLFRDRQPERGGRQQQPQRQQRKPPPQQRMREEQRYSDSGGLAGGGRRSTSLHSRGGSGTRDGGAVDLSPRSIMVEIFPGVHAKLRGADETRECVRTNSFVPCTCMSCSLDMFCIHDASYVLCPRCRVVSPLGSRNVGPGESLEISSNHSRESFFDDSFHHNRPPHSHDKHNTTNGGGGGLGLGFSMEDLQALQNEYMATRPRVSRYY